MKGSDFGLFIASINPLFYGGASGSNLLATFSEFKYHCHDHRSPVVKLAMFKNKNLDILSQASQKSCGFQSKCAASVKSSLLKRPQVFKS